METEGTKQCNVEDAVIENSRSVAFRDLPPIPKGADDGNYGTILLMYQYVEPLWTKKEHKKAIKKIIELGESLQITGRGRVAPEGVNFTLSGRPADVRSFCSGLRKWNPIFHETDFKLTDFVPRTKLFKSLSIRKTEELVAYGLAGDKAPSLKKFSGTHLEADEYHKAMKESDTVIIDVRNAYESAIGSFEPPKGGAELIDPKMRNSIEFPKWLNDPKTQEKLNGKKVLMYCKFDHPKFRVHQSTVREFSNIRLSFSTYRYWWDSMRTCYSSAQSNVDSQSRPQTQRSLSHAWGD